MAFEYFVCIVWLCTVMWWKGHVHGMFAVRRVCIVRFRSPALLANTVLYFVKLTTLSIVLWRFLGMDSELRCTSSCGCIHKF